MLIFIGLTIIFLYLISVPMRVKIKAGIDLESKKGKVSVSLFHVTVFRAAGEFNSISPTKSKVTLYNSKENQGYNVKMNPKIFFRVLSKIKNFNYMIFGNLNVREVYLKVNYGQGDAFKTVLNLNTARVVFYSLTSVLKSVQRLEVSEEFIPDFNKKTLQVDFHGILSLSIADIIYGFLLSKWNKYFKIIKNSLNRKTAKET